MEKACKGYFLQEIVWLRHIKKRDTFLKKETTLHLGKTSTSVLGETGVEAKLGGINLGNEKT